MKNSSHIGRMELSSKELRAGAREYVTALYKVLVKLAEKEMSNPMVRAKTIAIELVKIGYAAGVVAGKTSDVGVEGYTLILRGIEMSMQIEERAERMQYAVWDKDGDLHTSDDMKEGGEQ